MERPQENRDVANDGADSHHHEVAVPRAGPLDWRLGYLLLAAPVMSICAGLVDGPWAAGFAYASLLLGVGSIWRAMLPPRLQERARAEEDRAAANEDAFAGTHRGAASPDAAMAWCGYVLVAAPVMGSCAGLTDTPGAALLGYGVLLLGSALIGLAMLPPRPIERALEEERRAAGSGHRRGHQVVVRDAPGTVDWTGYVFVAAPVLASWAGFVGELVAAFFAFALLLLGVTFIIIAMLALAKPKVA